MTDATTTLGEWLNQFLPTQEIYEFHPNPLRALIHISVGAFIEDKGHLHEMFESEERDDEEFQRMLSTHGRLLYDGNVLELPHGGASYTLYWLDGDEQANQLILDAMGRPRSGWGEDCRRQGDA